MRRCVAAGGAFYSANPGPLHLRPCNINFIFQKISKKKQNLYVHYGPSMMMLKEVPWKVPEGSLQLLWGCFTWKDPSNLNVQLLRGLFTWKAPHSSCKDPSESFQGIFSFDIISCP
jgi:hypothetical protein